MSWTVYKELRKPALCGLCYFWILVRDEIVMCAPHVIGEKMLAQQMAQANKELKAGIEVRMLATPTDASKSLGMFDALNGSEDAAALAHRSPLLSQPQEKDVFIFIHNSKHLIPLNPNPSENTTGHIVAPKKMACGCDESFHLA
ncbi:hypothetical protein ACTACH_02965 [Pseudomonas syringae]|uniref:hypothetical protein n=1 Tax=Pseudomonas syringae TaxID=317 RepID=UPI001F480E52|nr:hypothetical protein [Pseudomonas syringae]